MTSNSLPINYKETNMAYDGDLIYLDYNATTPVDPNVADTILPYLFQNFGNPSNGYILGTTAKAAVEQSRELVSDLLQCDAEEIVFVSCATESINMSLRGAAVSSRRRNSMANHIITAKTEHIAVLNVCRYLETEGFQVTYLDVDEFGQISTEVLLNAITPSTCLISLMLANNETGTILDIATLCAAAKKKKSDIIFHTDCSAAIAKILVEVPILGVDLLTMAAHKIYAPKNCGVLYVRKGKLISFTNFIILRRRIRKVYVWSWSGAWYACWH